MTRRKGLGADRADSGSSGTGARSGQGGEERGEKEATLNPVNTRESRASQHLNLVNRDHQKRQNLSLSSFEVVVNRLKLNIGYEFIDCVQRSGAS